MFWVSLEFDPRFIRANGPSYILQIVMLGVLVYYAVPKLLFKNKYFSFSILVFLVIVLTAFIGTKIGPPPTPRPGFAPNGGGRPFVSSLFFRQLITMAITCLSAVIVETFTLAQQKQKSEALARAELKDSELKFLKMQINPHFLFNSLNNIYALSVTNSEKTQEGINTLSLMLRYVLYDCQQAKIPLRKELEYLHHFIELFKLKSSAEYNIKVVYEIEDESLLIAPMLFVPFIENAFKHSGIEKRGDSFVRLSLISKGQKLEFSVENSLASPSFITDEQGGIGLQNVEKRLKILYPETHTLNIRKTDTFYINLKINP